MTVNEKLSEEQETQKLASDAFYKRSKTPRHQTIMLKLLHANRLDNLHRTNKIAALAYFVEPDSKDLKIDYDTVDVLYSVSNALIATKKTKRWHQNFYYPIYPVSWGFQLTLKTYEKYILPWMKTYHFWKIFTVDYEKYLHRETWAYCPYCKEIILKIKRTSKENTIKQLGEEYKESFEEVKENLIDEEEIRKREAKTRKLAKYDYWDSYYRFVYKPPRWEGTYINCPKCEEKIRLTFHFYTGSYAKHFPSVEPPELELKEIIVENKAYYERIVEVDKFDNVSNYLTHKGYNQLINSFLDWAEPFVSRIEWEILKLVDPDTLQKYLDLEFKDLKEGEEQHQNNLEKGKGEPNFQ